MLFDTNYKNTTNLWGDKPSTLVTMFEKEFLNNCECLDIGCGQGRDTLYLANKGHKITAVDSSTVAIEQLNKLVEQNNIKNIFTINSNITDYSIESEKYGVILAINTLQFLPRKECLSFISKIKDKIVKDGIIIIKSFTINDNSFIKFRNNVTSTYFQPNELKDLFNDFKILNHFEYITLDPGHGEEKIPHLHGIVELVAKK